MKLISGIGLVLVFFAFNPGKPPRTTVFHVPVQAFDPYVEMGMKTYDSITVDSFSVTALVTLGEYKKYLDEARSDSGYAYYLRQLPDSGMCTREAYIKYMNTPAYDAYPVSGVSWMNAVNYCNWKTGKSNSGDSVQVICRLPTIAEWLSAYRYLLANGMPNDFNRNYSDWVMEAFDESAYNFNPGQKNKALHFSVFPDKEGDPPVLRRKRIVGNSFHMQHARLADVVLSHYGYSYEGYSYIGFRVVMSRPTTTGSRNWSRTQFKRNSPAKK